MSISERRGRPTLRGVIETAPALQKKALIFLARGAEPDRLDALESSLREKSFTPIESVYVELDEISKGASAKIRRVLPGSIGYSPGYGRDWNEFEVAYLEDLAGVPRECLLRQRGISVKTVDALAHVMEKRGIYFKGEIPKLAIARPGN